MITNTFHPFFLCSFVTSEHVFVCKNSWCIHGAIREYIYICIYIYIYIHIYIWYPQVFELPSFVNYTVDSYKKDLKQLDFPNYENFDDVDGAHCNFFQKIMTALMKLFSIEIK